MKAPAMKQDKEKQEPREEGETKGKGEEDHSNSQCRVNAVYVGELEVEESSCDCPQN